MIVYEVYVSFFVYWYNGCFSPFARINAFVKNCIQQFGHEKHLFLSTRLQHVGKYVIKTTSFSGFEIRNGFLYFIYSYFLVQKVISFLCYIVFLNIRLIGCFVKCVTKDTFKVIIPFTNINLIAYATSFLSPKTLQFFSKH